MPTDDVALLRGDCLEILPMLPDGCVDMVMTDPPYGTTACKWDTVIPLEPMWKELKRIIKPNGAIVMTASQPFTSALVMSNILWFKYDFSWDKRLSSGFLNAKKMPLRQHEDILVFGSGKLTYNPIMTVRGKIRAKGNNIKDGGSENYGYYKTAISYNNEYYPTSLLSISNADRKNKVHPTQKPVALMEYLIKTYTNEGEMVLDFCAGSGTTGVACLNTGRQCILIEKEPTYWPIIEKRICDVI